ncbi:MAG: type IX secretion system membrane protein PorP/SprF [Bacteroidales bacterium]|nr:type IX secretion system membrane protein PorP/SprF [Bacteroidales bacterium]
MNAQQAPIFDHYMYVTQWYNSGYAGSQDMIWANIVVNSRMLGFGDGKPQDISASVNLPFNLFGKEHGAGFAFNNGQVGFFRTNHIKLAYAYRADLGNGKLGIGLAPGVYIHHLKVDAWKPTETGLSTPFYYDETLPKAEDQYYKFDMDAGLFYKADDLYMGISHKYRFTYN